MGGGEGGERAARAGGDAQKKGARSVDHRSRAVHGPPTARPRPRWWRQADGVVALVSAGGVGGG